MSTEPHVALKIPLIERVHYLSIVASMAAADASLSSDELAMLRTLCADLQLPPHETEQVMETAHHPTASLERHLEGLKSSELKYGLLTDCIALAYSDGVYEDDEKVEVRSLARALEVSEEQLVALEACAKAAFEAHKAAHAGDHHSSGEHIASQLAAVGVPVAAVATVSALGLTTAGVSSGLAAFAMGLGIASGFGAAIGLGVGTYVGVRWAHKKLSAKA